MKKAIISFCIYMLSVGGLTAAELSNVDIHGFVSQGYLYTKDNNFLADTEGGTEEYSEAGINFSTDISNKLRIGLQLMARDMGEFGNNEVILDWAFFDYSWRDWVGFRAGKIKYPFGLYNESRDIDAARTFIMLPQSIYVELSKDINNSVQGGGFYGEVPLNMMGSLGYQLMAGRFEMDEDSGTAKRLKGVGYDTLDNIDVDTMYVGQLKWQTPLDGLIIAWTGLKMGIEMDAAITGSYTYDTTVPLWYIGPNPPTQADLSDPDNYTTVPQPEGVGNTQPDMYQQVTTSMDYTQNLHHDMSSIEQSILSVEYSIADLVLAFEMIWSDVESSIYDPATGELAVDPSTGLPLADDLVNKQNNWYVSASYRFTDWFELGAYYSESYADKNDKNGKKGGASGRYSQLSDAWLKETVLTTRFDLNEYWTLKLEVHSNDGTYWVDPGDDGTKEEDWYMFAAKITARF